jgi:predicted amidophosphoribosyltransferase
MALLSELSHLLFPIRCFGCRDLGFSICSECRKLWNSHIYRNRFDELTVFSSIIYSPIAKNIILAAKEGSIQSADKLVKEALKNSLKYLFESYPISALVPIPSQHTAIRRRGRDFLSEIAQDLGKFYGVGVLNLLEHNRRVQDQSRLGTTARHENLHRALEVSHRISGNYSAQKVVILDDLLTTGATLSEANRALRKAGFNVQAAATACVAVRRSN